MKCDSYTSEALRRMDDAAKLAYETIDRETCREAERNGHKTATADDVASALNRILATVKGWDEQEKLQLREGVEYVSRDGSYTTKVELYVHAELNGLFYKWRGTTKPYYTYGDNGCLFVKELDGYDLIAEVPPPKPEHRVWCNEQNGPIDGPGCTCNRNSIPPKPEPEQFKAGDWVVCVDASPHATGRCVLHNEAVYQISGIDQLGKTVYSLFLSGVFVTDEHGRRLSFGPHRFRRATPAEIRSHKTEHGLTITDDDWSEEERKALAEQVVAAVERSAAEFPERLEQHTKQPDGEGWIAHDGKGCPVDGEQWVEARFRDGKTRKRKAGSWHACWLSDFDHAPITHYRLVKPAPPTSWCIVNGVDQCL